MSTQQKPFYTLAEYLALEKESAERHEYWDGQIFSMSGGSKEHAFIIDNLARRLGNQLEGHNCRVMSSTVPIKTLPMPPYKYPDVSVACGALKFEKISGIDILVNPILIVEVLSPTTERIDRSPKFNIYKSIASFKEYLLIAQDMPYITQFVKQDDNSWKPDAVSGIESKIYLPSIDCTLSLSEIYQGVEF